MLFGYKGKVMRKRQWMRIWVMAAIAVLPAAMFTGCKNEENTKTYQAYYVISEELDVKRTADKAQEILENAESPVESISVK